MPASHLVESGVDGGVIGWGRWTGGVARSAANIDDEWIGTNVAKKLGKRCPGFVTVLNDADAAGMAELAYGEAKDQPGTNILLTIGTGIGSALISEGRLVPNTEFGHLEFRGLRSQSPISHSPENPQWAKVSNSSSGISSSSSTNIAPFLIRLLTT